MASARELSDDHARDSEAPRLRPSLRIGRIAGIEIRVHATFALLLLLVVAATAAPEGPTLAEELIWLAVVFGGVTIHELAHSLVARSCGIAVAEIDLLPIGGVSRLRSLPRDPRQQLQIAIAGPLMSVGLGIACAVVGLAAGAQLWPPTLVGGSLIARAAWVNLMLAGFNLVPAFPLDGGRVFRAYLAEHMDGDAATTIAARTGRQMAIGMMVLGALVNFWLLLIGVFVYFGSAAEEAAAMVHHAIAILRVRDVVTEALPAPLEDQLAGPVDADSLVTETDLLTSDFVARPAVRDGHVVGYVTHGDLDAVVDALVARQRHELRAGRATSGPRPARG